MGSRRSAKFSWRLWEWATSSANLTIVVNPTAHPAILHFATSLGLALWVMGCKSVSMCYNGLLAGFWALGASRHFEDTKAIRSYSILPYL